ncbi:hypothetical protein [Hyalangium gracile]|uniref:hypothetical protein n=1 Tax=Hyalangium gracile TaxID=394092 RepID=UPI001CCB201A|nr:hypothetical protein [Hyalangium gracile]
MDHALSPGLTLSLPRWLLALAMAGLVLLPPSARAVDAPRQMTFQGRLLRADNSPETTPQDLRFALYATPTGGSPLWEETFPATAVTNGYYSVVLGTSTPLPASVFNGQALYLGVSVLGQSELTPRLAVVSTPYALLANDSNRLEGRNAASFADSNHPHNNATTTTSGFMSSADKSKLNGLPSTIGAGLNNTSGTLTVAFGSSGTANAAARSDHTHPAPTLGCIHRMAKGNIDTNKNSTAWCATNEILTGGGCSDLNGATIGAGITFGPTGVTFVDGSTPTGGQGYTCRLPNPPTNASIPTAYAICCRLQ